MRRLLIVGAVILVVALVAWSLFRQPPQRPVMVTHAVAVVPVEALPADSAEPLVAEPEAPVAAEGAPEPEHADEPSNDDLLVSRNLMDAREDHLGR